MKNISAVEIAQLGRAELLKSKVGAGKVLSAAEISELGRYEPMAKKKKNDKEVNRSAVQCAEKRRYLFLLEKVKDNKRLSTGELKELKKYEEIRAAEADVLQTRAEAAAYASVSAITIYRWGKQGLARLEGGGYSKKLIDAFLEKRKASKQAAKSKKLAAEKLNKPLTPSPLPLTPDTYTGVFFTPAELEAAELAEEASVEWDELSDTEKDRRRKEKKRRSERQVFIPPVKDWDRRNSCENDHIKFLKTYFPDLFYLPFSDNQVNIADELAGRIRFGGLKALAAERGGGKSTITKCLIVWGICYGHKKFPVLIGANGPFAEAMLDDIKSFFEFNDTLCEDFPEICIPVRALDGANQRAGSQTANGERTRLQWSGREIVFPYIKDKYGNPSPSSGTIVTTRGLDAAIRGIQKAGRRPDVGVIDDAETEESARSVTEIRKRKETIINAILGLGGPGKLFPVFLLGTIQRLGCVTEQLTDPKLNPAWGGSRHKKLLKEPDNTEMWARYIQMRKIDQQNGDPHGRKAQQYYLDNREKMDAGAVVSNMHNYITEPAEDGQPAEVSALQSCYNIIADKGQGYFDTECQNTPPDTTADGLGIELVHVQRKLNGIPRGVVPKGCTLITCAVDIRRREFHWSAVAWKAGAVGFIIDYGFGEIQSPNGRLIDKAEKLAQEKAIVKSLLEFKHNIIDRGWEIEGSGPSTGSGQGEMRKIDIAFVDAGYMPDAVHSFCRTTAGRFKPVRGFGTNQFAGKTYRKPSKQKLPSGEHWHAEFRPQTRQAYYALDVDWAKVKVHEGFLIRADQNGALSLWGDDPIEHSNFADHILAERYESEFVEGKGSKEGWKQLHGRNHWLDTAGYNVIAAEMRGVSVMRVKRQASSVKRKPKRKGGFLGNLPTVRI